MKMFMWSSVVICTSRRMTSTGGLRRTYLIVRRRERVSAFDIGGTYDKEYGPGRAG